MTTVYKKMYLNVASCTTRSLAARHSTPGPRHCKNYIPYSVALRLKRNCLTEEFLTKRVNTNNI
jgi:hypothetical protein